MKNLIKCFALSLALASSAHAATDIVESADLLALKNAADITAIATAVGAFTSTGGAAIEQAGSGDVASISQLPGVGNFASIYQAASDQTAAIDQSGTSATNFAVINQLSQGAAASINQSAATGSKAYILQGSAAAAD